MHIIVTGIPASGKSTVGAIIAKSLNLEFLDKDQILEALFESEGIGDADWRRKLSRQADEMLRERALHTDGAVVVSWWRHPQSAKNSGTGIEWLTELNEKLTEVYCECDPGIAATRFTQRRRHAGHLDQTKLFDELIVEFEQHARLGPLGLGRLVRVNTNQKIDEQALIGTLNNKAFNPEQDD